MYHIIIIENCKQMKIFGTEYRYRIFNKNEIYYTNNTIQFPIDYLKIKI